MKFQSPSVHPASRLAVAGDILMVLGHHLILDIAQKEKPMIEFIRLPPSVHPVAHPVVAAGILMALWHHLILDMARIDKPMMRFIQLRAPAISRKGQVREPVKFENLYCPRTCPVGYDIVRKPYIYLVKLF